MYFNYIGTYVHPVPSIRIIAIYLFFSWQYKRRKNSLNQTDLEDLKRQNNHLEAQIRALERAKSLGNFGKSAAEILNDQGLMAEGENLPTANDLEPSAAGPGARSVAPGQSLLLNNSDNVDPPRKKVKQLWKHFHHSV